MFEKETLIIYADSSVAPNNNGGVGIRIIAIDEDGNDAIYDSSRAGYPNANSGQMEIIACTAALEEAARLQLTLSTENVLIRTDSKYVADNYKKAMFGFSNNKKWASKHGRPVKDAHLWIDLVKQIKKYSNDRVYVEIKWVKGHADDKHNRYVDGIAKKAARLPPDKIPKSGPISISQPRKVISSPKMELGSVKMEGQKISVKILSAIFLRPQNVWCYQYLVISKNSPFLGCVDQIFSIVSLDTGKEYYVKLNLVTENPRIEKLYREIKH